MTAAGPAYLPISTPKRVLLAAQSLAAAMVDDPLFQYFVPVLEDRLRQLPLLMRASLELFDGIGVSWTTDESARAVLLAQPPAMRSVPKLRLGMLIAKYGFRFRSDTRGRLLRTMNELEHGRPAAAHYYLMLLGVVPELQGQGAGGRLLASLLDKADQENVAIHLETAKPANVAFYERFGFSVLRTARCDHGRGPEMFFMARPSGKQRAG